jgi:hypothetical protein
MCVPLYYRRAGYCSNLHGTRVTHYRRTLPQPAGHAVLPKLIHSFPPSPRPTPNVPRGPTTGELCPNLHRMLVWCRCAFHVQLPTQVGWVRWSDPPSSHTRTPRRCSRSTHTCHRHGRYVRRGRCCDSSIVGEVSRGLDPATPWGTLYVALTPGTGTPSLVHRSCTLLPATLVSTTSSLCGLLRAQPAALRDVTRPYSLASQP